MQQLESQPSSIGTEFSRGLRSLAVGLLGLGLGIGVAGCREKLEPGAPVPAVGQDTGNGTFLLRFENNHDDIDDLAVQLKGFNDTHPDRRIVEIEGIEAGHGHTVALVLRTETVEPTTRPAR